MEKEESKKAQVNRQLTVKEMLIYIYNDHISTYTKQLVELNFCAGRPVDEIVLTIIEQIAPNLPPVERKIKAKEGQIKAKNALSREDSILKVISRLIKEEEKKETTFES